jgi:hypothetical protein
MYREYHLVCRKLMENHGQERGDLGDMVRSDSHSEVFQRRECQTKNGVIVHQPDFENQGAAPKSTSPSEKVHATSATTTTLSTATTYALMSQESVMLGKPYVQKPDSGNNDYMRRRYRFSNNTSF